MLTSTDWFWFGVVIFVVTNVADLFLHEDMAVRFGVLAFLVCLGVSDILRKMERKP